MLVLNPAVFLSNEIHDCDLVIVEIEQEKIPFWCPISLTTSGLGSLCAKIGNAMSPVTTRLVANYWKKNDKFSKLARGVL